MSRHDDEVYVRHMLDHARTALELSSGKDRLSLDTEPMFRYALLHLVSILGEAAARLSVASRSRYPEIVWRDIVGMRNMLIHGYDVVDLDILWKTVEDDIPALISKLESILEKKSGS